MAPRRRALAAAACVFAVAVAPAIVAAPAACAAEGSHAVLVVDPGSEGELQRFCVALPDEEVSGIELIELAGEQHGLTYRFGYGGEAVCMLAGVGSESDDCFEDYPDFWGYWRGDGSGGWSWSGSGAGSTVVEDGDVEGWSWGSGNDGDTHPRPPETTFESVCGRSPAGEDEAAVPASRKRASGGGSSQRTPAGERRERELRATTRKLQRELRAAPVRDDDGRRGEVRRLGRLLERMHLVERRLNDLAQMTPRSAASPPPAQLEVATSKPPRSEGPPAAGLAAVAAALALALVGGVLVRRRSAG